MSDDTDRTETLELVSRLYENNRGFQLLREEVGRAKEIYFQKLAKRVANPHQPAMTEAEQQFEKGYWAAVEWLLEKLPANLDREFKKMLASNETEDDRD